MLTVKRRVAAGTGSFCSLEGYNLVFASGMLACWDAPDWTLQHCVSGRIAVLSLDQWDLCLQHRPSCTT